MVTCEVGLLGGFRVQFDGRSVPGTAWRHRRAADLVKVLALSPGHRAHREQLMDLFWPELTPEQAGANLRKAVHFARQVMGSEAAIGTRSEMVDLHPTGLVVVDIEDFEAAAREALRSGDPRACAQCAAMYHGDLLPEDRYATWADEARERSRQRYLEVLKAGRLWDRVVEVDPLDEDAHSALMQDALDAGDRHGAIRQFDRLRKRLRIDLGLGPSRSSVALYEKALAMDGPEPPSVAEKTRALLAWGLVHLNAGDPSEAERTAHAARSLAIDAGLGREIGEASALLGMVANTQGRWKDLFRSEFVDSVRGGTEVASFVFDAHLCLAEFSLCGVAGHEDIAAYAKELMTVAEQADSTQGRALASLILGEAELFSGRLDEAERYLDAAERLHARADAKGGRALATERLAEVALARGEPGSALALARRARALASASPLEPHLLVRVLALEIEILEDDALEALRSGDRELAGREVCMPCSMGFRVEAVKALARTGEIVEGRRRLDEAERLAGMWRGGPWLAAVWEARAALRRAEGDAVQAGALFKEAADLFRSFSRPRDEARCRAAVLAAGA